MRKTFPPTADPDLTPGWRLMCFIIRSAQQKKFLISRNNLTRWLTRGAESKSGDGDFWSVFISLWRISWKSRRSLMENIEFKNSLPISEASVWTTAGTRRTRSVVLTCCTFGRKLCEVEIISGILHIANLLSFNSIKAALVIHWSCSSGHNTL